MSATGRADVRHPEDFYETPSWATRAILPHLDLSGTIMEPCAGRGAIILELDRAGVTAEQIVANEFDVARSDECQARTWVRCAARNFLDPSITWPKVDLILTNPPYAPAEQFARRGLEIVGQTGEVALLLRINFLASLKRIAFWKEHPAHLFVLPKRPSFVTVLQDVFQCLRCKRKWKVLHDLGPFAIPVDDQCECGEIPVFRKTVKTANDATEYGWFLFGPKRERRWDVLELPEDVLTAGKKGGKDGSISRANNRRVRGQLQKAEGRQLVG